MALLIEAIFIVAVLGDRGNKNWKYGRSNSNSNSFTYDRLNTYDRSYGNPYGNSYGNSYATATNVDTGNYNSYDCKDSWANNANYDVSAARIYYIACVEEEWDYAPSGYDLIDGLKIEEGMVSGADEWLYGNGYDRIGRKYIKSRYVEFTDLCFNERKEIDQMNAHLGVIGPSIRAITGEKIKIYYQNQCTFPNSMHPHGMKYDKKSEGAPYEDDSTAGDIVEPDEQWIYVWEAREGTVDDGVSSQMWLYHSHVDEVKDVLSGLIGGIIITKKGYETSDKNLMPTDVSREFVTFMVMFDENETWFIEENIDKYLYSDKFNGNEEKLMRDFDFQESNKMHSINGYLFGNLNQLKSAGNELVRWYTASFGNEKDGPHSPHWHGNIVKNTAGQNLDTVVLIGGTTDTVTMHVDNTGEWLYHCHVFDHLVAGMITTYTVEQETA